MPAASRLQLLRRTIVLVALCAIAATMLPTAAFAKSYSVPKADIALTLRPDGTLAVSEGLTMAFRGDFTASYREIPTNQATIGEVRVTDQGQPYAPGAGVEIGGTGTPRTFGSENVGGNWHRIVWYHGASDETRMFTVSYTMSGTVDAYADVVDVYVQVWGDDWPVGVDQLTATLDLPRTPTAAERKLVRVWGMPAQVQGRSTFDGQRLSLKATGVPANQFVELRATVPRAMLGANLAGARVKPGNGLDRIVSEQQTDFAGSRFGTSPDSAPSGDAPSGSRTFTLAIVGAAVLWVIGLALAFSTGGARRAGWYVAITGTLLVAALFFLMRSASASADSDSDSGFGGSFGGDGGGGGGGGGGGSW